MMMKRMLTIGTLLTLTLGATAQILDMDKEKITWISHLNHTAGKEDQSMVPHRITFDLQKKFITIANENTGSVVYDLTYSTAYSGQNKSVVLQDGETMFMVRDDKVTLATFDENSQTLSLIHFDNTIRLYGKMQVLDATAGGE